MTAQPASRAFVIEWAPARGEYALDSIEVEHIYLPRLGPTSWTLLRLFAEPLSHCIDGVTLPPPETYTLATLGALTGTSSVRVWSSVQRLVQFRVLVVAPTLNDDVPRFVLRPTLPSLTTSEWRRLPLIVRSRYDDLRPSHV